MSRIGPTKASLAAAVFAVAALAPAGLVAQALPTFDLVPSAPTNRDPITFNVVESGDYCGLPPFLFEVSDGLVRIARAGDTGFLSTRPCPWSVQIGKLNPGNYTVVYGDSPNEFQLPLAVRAVDSRRVTIELVPPTPTNLDDLAIRITDTDPRCPATVPALTVGSPRRELTLTRAALGPPRSVPCEWVVPVADYVIGPFSLVYRDTPDDVGFRRRNVVGLAQVSYPYLQLRAPRPVAGERVVLRVFDYYGCVARAYSISGNTITFDPPLSQTSASSPCRADYDLGALPVGNYTVRYAGGTPFLPTTVFAFAVGSAEPIPMLSPVALGLLCALLLAATWALRERPNL